MQNSSSPASSLNTKIWRSRLHLDSSQIAALLVAVVTLLLFLSLILPLPWYNWAGATYDRFGLASSYDTTSISIYKAHDPDPPFTDALPEIVAMFTALNIAGYKLLLSKNNSRVRKVMAGLVLSFNFVLLWGAFYYNNAVTGAIGSYLFTTGVGIIGLVNLYSCWLLLKPGLHWISRGNKR